MTSLPADSVAAPSLSGVYPASTVKVLFETYSTAAEATYSDGPGISDLT